MKNLFFLSAVLLALSACGSSDQQETQIGHVIPGVLAEQLIGPWRTTCDSQHETEIFFNAGDGQDVVTKSDVTFADQTCAKEKQKVSLVADGTKMSYEVVGQGKKARGVIKVTSTFDGQSTVKNYVVSIIRTATGLLLTLKAQDNSEPTQAYYR